MLFYKKFTYLFFLVYTLSFSQNINNLPELIKKTDPSILKIFTLDTKNKPIKQGSAVIISSNGTCISNYHVLAGAKKAVAIDYLGNEYKINEIIDYSKNSDLIKFKINTNKKLIYSKISSRELSKGSSVYAMGFPNGFEIDGESTVSTGIISGSRIIDKIEYIQTTTPITYGSSGGGLFNTSGYLVGITTGTFAEKIENRHANLNKVVSSRYIKKLDENRNLTLMQFYNKIKNTNVYSQAFIEYEKHNWVKASDLFYLHLKDFADDATAWFRLGNCLNQMGRPSEKNNTELLETAITCFQNAIDLAPTYFFPHFQAAIVSIYLKKWPVAFKFALAAYNLEPKSQNGNYILGYYYNNKKEFKKSIAYFTKAINYTKKDIPEQYNKMSDLYLERAIAKDLLYSDFTAESDYQNSLKLTPNKQTTLANYAHFLINRNKKNKACVFVQRLYKINPNYLLYKNASVSKYYIQHCK